MTQESHVNLSNNKMADPGGERPPPYSYGAIPQQPGYAPPPPYPQGAPDMKGFPPPQGAATTTTIISQPQPQPVMLSIVFMEAPVSMVCGHCQAHIITCTSYENGTLTWLTAGGLLLVGCWVGCCLIPFCVDGLRDVIHSCPNCRARLGVYRRI